jgi:serine phosphatase RsbU (regulator of sigma subunit)/HAMP domain-containing protein
MDVRFTIPWKIGVGFGVFIITVAFLFFLTRQTLSESREISSRIDEVYAPSIELLESLSSELTYSRVLIKHWAAVQSRPDVMEKTLLLNLMNDKVPLQLERLDYIAKEWDGTDQRSLDSLQNAVSRLFIVYNQITRLLPDFDSYSNPNSIMAVDYLFLEGEGIDKCTTEVESRVIRLLARQRTHLGTSSQEMNNLGDRLRLFAGNIAIVVLFLGIFIAFSVSRSIVKPISELKRTLLYLGKGIYPRGTVQVTSDEIGDMAFAVNRLVDGLKKTREFSSQVGGGNFEASYSPLSEDDELGYALLKMRDDLAANERLLERKVEERTNEVVQQKEEIERQKERVMELYKDLTDSINYAKRIQQTILPTREYILEMFPDSFVFFKPRDIVSGDFYWFKNGGRKKYVAAVDCTGHGVPGAFMSLVGYNALNHVTKVFTRPAQVLNHLNRLASETLRSEARDMHLTDGMDLAFLSFDSETLEMEYAGAHNPVYIVRNKEMIVIDPDKFSIGSFLQGDREFTNHTIQLEQGDAVYVFSDGYVDQFGGPKGKKFLKKQFREMLLELSHLPMAEQGVQINERLIAWKKMYDQVDDILVLGIRI